jgi:hypothetical protein
MDKESDEKNNTIHKDALLNLKSFHSDHKLQQATWVYLVNLLGSKDDKEHLNVVFNQLDANKDGCLTKEELLDGWNNTFKTRLTDLEIE